MVRCLLKTRCTLSFRKGTVPLHVQVQGNLSWMQTLKQHRTHLWVLEGQLRELHVYPEHAHNLGLDPTEPHLNNAFSALEKATPAHASGHAQALGPAYPNLLLVPVRPGHCKPTPARASRVCTGPASPARAVR